MKWLKLHCVEVPDSFQFSMLKYGEKTTTKLLCPFKMDQGGGGIKATAANIARKPQVVFLK